MNHKDDLDDHVHQKNIISILKTNSEITFHLLVILILLPILSAFLKLVQQDYYVKFSFKGEKIIHFADAMSPGYIDIFQDYTLFIIYCSVTFLSLVLYINFFFNSFGKLFEEYEKNLSRKLWFNIAEKITEYAGLKIIVVFLLIYASFCYKRWVGLLMVSQFWMVSFGFLSIILWIWVVFNLVDKVFIEKVLRYKKFFLVGVFILTALWTVIFFVQRNNNKSYDLTELLGRNVLSISQEDTWIKIVKENETIFIPIKVHVSRMRENSFINNISWNEESSISWEQYYFTLSDFLDRYYQPDEQSSIANYLNCLEEMQDDYRTDSYQDVSSCIKPEETEIYDPYHQLSASLLAFKKIHDKHVWGLKYSILWKEIN